MTLNIHPLSSRRMDFVSSLFLNLTSCVLQSKMCGLCAFVVSSKTQEGSLSVSTINDKVPLLCQERFSESTRSTKGYLVRLDKSQEAHKKRFFPFVWDLISWLWLELKFLLRWCITIENKGKETASLDSPLCLCFLQTPEELEDDSDFEQEDYDTRSRTSVQTEDDQLIAGQSARVSGCSLPHCAETSWMNLSYGTWQKMILKKSIFPDYTSIINQFIQLVSHA